MKIALPKEHWTTAIYIVLLVFFAAIGIVLESLPWKLFSAGIVLCALIGIPFRVFVLRKGITEENKLTVKGQRLMFWDKFIEIVPMSIVFYVGAIYSLVYSGEFLAMSTSIMLLVFPLITTFKLFKSK